MLVKVCGITREGDAQLAVALGASALGFVFWPKSPRFIDPFRARAIAASLPFGVTPVGVFVDQPPAYVNGVASLVRLGAVQLHGRESRAEAWTITRPVLKAIALEPLAPGEEDRVLDEWGPPMTVLLDAHDPVRRGGTGRTIDWSRAASIARRRRVLLAGGLTAANVGEAIAHVRPFGIDVSSGVESAPGIKDPERLHAFFGAVRGTASLEVGR